MEGALPEQVQWRPSREHPLPRIHGIQTATVVGPPGEEIHTDEFGRVRVHFHWDRESSMDDKSSCWIHVSQSWAGSGYGWVTLPRIGQEVLVDFLGGDPDRPIIVGRVYTNLQKVPYKLPDNKPISTSFLLCGSRGLRNKGNLAEYQIKEMSRFIEAAHGTTVPSSTAA